MFLFVGTYHDNPFGFFDLFVKRGAAIVVSVAALTAWFAVVFPVLAPFRTTWAAPWIHAIVLLPVIVALPWIHARIRAVLDRRWLGRRYSTIDAVKHFLGTLRSATTEALLIDRAQAGLEEIFGAKATVHLGASAPAGPVDQEVLVRSADRIVGRFLMGPRHSEAPYFSEDVALLDVARRRVLATSSTTSTCRSGSRSRSSARASCPCTRAAPSSRRCARRSTRTSCSTRSTRSPA